MDSRPIHFLNTRFSNIIQSVASLLIHQILTLKDDYKHNNNPCFDCVNPCSTHLSYPSYLKIDYDSSLEGTVKPYFKHVLISTGKTDWIIRIEDDSASLASQLHKIIKSGGDGKKLLRIVITNCDRVNTDKDLKFSKGNDVLLFPDNILIYNVNPKNALEFFKKFLLPSPSSTPQPPPSLSNQEQNIYSSTNFQVDPIPYKAVIVICSHRRRDKRCGITGPILKNEFDRILKDRGLDVENKKNEGVAVFLSSHKYAGNVIVYRDGQGIWYGHVIPCHVENIIESTVIEGKVIRDLYRGSMNGSFDEGPANTNSPYTINDLISKVDSLMDTCDYELALKFCLRALSLDPNSTKVLEILGVNEIELEMFEEAKEHFSKAISINPNQGYSKYMYMGQLTNDERENAGEGSNDDDDDIKSKEILKRKISSALCSMVEIYLTDCCYESDAEIKCENYLNQAVEIDPTNPEIFQCLASVRLSQERNEEAKVALEKSLSLWINNNYESDYNHPSSSIPSYETRISLVKLLLELSEYTKALLVLETLQKENDQVVDLWYLYGWCYFCMSEETENEGDQQIHLEDSQECLITCKNLYHKLDYDDQDILQHTQDEDEDFNNNNVMEL
ncbi:3535_t:CDS:10 [Entrophospora sp. SA101]|nr:3535_t:CDS:10 [Entrophospora sp. SA101]